MLNKSSKHMSLERKVIIKRERLSNEIQKCTNDHKIFLFKYFNYPRF